MQPLKRLLSLLLVFTMLSALLPATALAATNAPIRDADETTSASHGYVEAVEKAIEVVESLYGGTGHGALYDVNDDGIQELILLHDDWMSYREGAAPVVKYSIFTMADGNAVLLHEEKLFTHESGWYGQLSIVQQNGQVYLATTSSTERGSRYHAHWTLYQLEGTNLVQKSDVKYCLQEDYLDNYNKKVNSEESYTQIDGKKSSYRDFEKWKDTVDVLLTVDYYDAYETAYGKSMSLNDLLQLLKNDPSIIGKDSTQDTTGTQKAVTSIKSYNKKGKLNWEEAVVYDDQWRVIQFGSVPHPYKYAYDENGNLLYRKTGDSGEIFTEEKGSYLISGNFASGTSYEYNSAGQMVKSESWSGGGGGKSTYTYDANGRRESSVEKYDVATYNSAYIYDSNDLLIEKETTIKEFDYTWLETTTYLYDSQNRITETKTEGGNSVTRYTYDYSHKPFTVYNYYIDGKLSSVSVSIDDPHGEFITSFWIDDADATYTTDADGYVTRIDTNDGHYELTYALIPQSPENTSSLTPDQLKWVTQHIDYINSVNFDKEIVGGYNDALLAVLRHAANSEDIENYQIAKTVSRLLNLDVDLSQSQMYELILAQLLQSNAGISLTEELYTQNLNQATRSNIDTLYNIANGIDTASKIPQNVRNSIDDAYSLLKTMHIGSGDFEKTYDQFVSLVFKNITRADFIKGLKEDALLSTIGLFVDDIVERYEAEEDILRYLNNYIAYQLTSEQFEEVIFRLAAVVFVEYENIYGVSAVIDELGLNSAFLHWSELGPALSSFLVALDNYKNIGADAVSAYAVERYSEVKNKTDENLNRSVTLFIVKSISSQIPVLNVLSTAGSVLDVSLLINELLTNIEDRKAAVDMLGKLYCISFALDVAIDNCTYDVKNGDYYTSTVFDEAISIYKNTQLLAINYADHYLQLTLDDMYRKYLSPFLWGGGNPSDLKKIEDLHILQSNLSTQRHEIYSINCHEAISATPPSENTSPTNILDSRIFVVACPVDVSVINAEGIQIAYLSEDNPSIPAEYRHCFRVIETEEASGDYMKIAIVPKDYRIEIYGTASGLMDILVMDYSTGSLNVSESYADISVSNSMIVQLNPHESLPNQIQFARIETVTTIGYPVIIGLAVGSGCVLLAAYATIVLISRKGKQKSRSNPPS